jgi:hypothetical protein
MWQLYCPYTVCLGRFRSESKGDQMANPFASEEWQRLKSEADSYPGISGGNMGDSARAAMFRFLIKHGSPSDADSAFYGLQTSVNSIVYSYANHKDPYVDLEILDHIDAYLALNRTYERSHGFSFNLHSVFLRNLEEFTEFGGYEVGGRWGRGYEFYEVIYAANGRLCIESLPEPKKHRKHSGWRLALVS